MVEIELICIGAGIVLGMLFGQLITGFIGFSPKQVATQICEYLDTGLVDYKVSGREFEYIKCGEQELIEGINVDKLISIIGD